MNMSAFLTTAGSAVVTRLLATQGPLVFTRAELGSGSVTSAEAARARESLICKVADASLVSCSLDNDQAVVDVRYGNEGQTENMTVDEVAVYCRDPEDATREILYCYATLGDTPDTIAAATAALYTRVYKVTIQVGELTNVTVTVTPAETVSQSQFDAHAHGNVTNGGALTATAAGTPGTDAILPVFAGSDDKLGVLQPGPARMALGAASTADYTATLTTTWTGSEAPYTQTVAVSGLLATDKPVVALLPSNTYADAVAQCKEWAKVYRVVTAAGSITAYATAAPSVALPIGLKVVR